MSSLQRVAHVTGLNNPFQGQIPSPGSIYVPQDGGAPGILSGPAGGFTVCVGLYMNSSEGEAPWVNFEPDSFPGSGVAPPWDETVPIIEYIGGTSNIASSNGYAFHTNSGNTLTLVLSDGSLDLDITEGRPDLIVMASYVPSDLFFGGAGLQRVSLAANGYLRNGTATGFTAYEPRHEFFLGGIIDSTLEASMAAGDIGGIRNTAQLNSFWITEGIPTLEQAQFFFETSMQAGKVVPQPWAVARTGAAPTPTVPDNPTGHFWDATDVDLSSGVGGEWTDRIGGVVLERVGTDNGEAREVGRQGTFFSPLNVV